MPPLSITPDVPIPDRPPPPPPSPSPSSIRVAYDLPVWSSEVKHISLFRSSAGEMVDRFADLNICGLDTSIDPARTFESKLVLSANYASLSCMFAALSFSLQNGVVPQCPENFRTVFRAIDLLVRIVEAQAGMARSIMVLDGSKFESVHDRVADCFVGVVGSISPCPHGFSADFCNSLAPLIRTYDNVNNILVLIKEGPHPSFETWVGTIPKQAIGQ